MATVTLPGIGQDVATDLIGGAHYQFIKIGFGAAGAFSGVDASNPLPVVDAKLTDGTQRAKVTDGTNDAAVKAGSTAAVAADKALVVAISPNNAPTVNIGTAGTLALDATLTGNNQRTRITDGTSLAAVKAASTPAAASDPALVVAVSPNLGVKVFDGTNTAAVKAASTPAAGTDPALVVAVSPNNTVGVTGTVTSNAGTGTFSVGGVAAHDAPVSGNPELVAAYASAAAPAAVSGDGDVVRLWATRIGQLATVAAGLEAHDAALTSNPIVQGAYASAAAPTNVSADGDLVRLWALRSGALATQITAGGALVGGDAANGLDVDVTRIGGSVTVVSPTAGNLLAKAVVTDGTNDAAVKAASTAAVATDKALVVAVSPNNAVAVTQSTSPWATGGNVAHDAADSGNPVKVGSKAINAWPAAVANLDRADAVGDLLGRQLVAFKPSELQKSFNPAQFTAAQTGTALWTPAAGKRIVVTSVSISTSGTTAGKVTLWFGASADTAYTAGTDQPLEVFNFAPATSANPGMTKSYADPIACLNADYILRITTSAALTCDITVHGYEI